MGKPQKLPDPAAGRCEFINAVNAKERWVVDEVAYAEKASYNSIKTIVCNILKADLPLEYFDGIFVSNFLEHLATPKEVHTFLVKMRQAIFPQGKIAIMGANFKYCASEYFDCADHSLALTNLSVAEHLFAAGFIVKKSIPRFLPYSFRGFLPPLPSLTALYLKIPLAWRFLGKQFLLIAEPDQDHNSDRKGLA